MRRTIVFSAIAAMILVQAALAIPMGGPGSRTHEMVKGTYTIEGTLEVNGNTLLSGQKYIWPKQAAEAGMILRNTGKGILAWDSEVAPAGPLGAVQINKDGVFYGDETLVYDPMTKALSVAKVPVSLTGHKHAAADINTGILGQANGGTGSNDGSIVGLGEVKVMAGGTNQNVTLSPSGTGSVTVSSPVVAAGPVRTETGFNVKGTDGMTGTYDIVSDVRFNGSTLQKKIKTVTVIGGLITSIGIESDWLDAGSIPAPVAPAAPKI